MIGQKVNLKSYIDYRYNESLSEVEILDSDSPETAEKRKISHLTLNWFMQTLLDRSDRMAMYNGFELRVPFCDYRLAQYVWNIPWEIKALNGREKGLLRYICKDFLPDEIVDFYEDLASLDLTGKIYGVVGSGDTFYDEFCKAVDDFDRAFAATGAEKGAEPSSWNHSADLHHVFCGDRLDHFQMRRYGIWDLVSESHVWRIRTGPVE